MFTKVLIANRGAIACRIERTLRRMGVRSVAVFSDADAGSLHVSGADEAVHIGPAPAARSYLDADALLAAARATGAQAIHPGYGFLSENAAFAQRCADAGIAFIGPTAGNIRAFGLKHTARARARAQGVPLMPGTDLLADAAAAATAAAGIGYPIMLKSTAGGGGIGMRICEDAAALMECFESVGRIAGSNFGDAGVFLERYVRHARHIEVQVFGDGCGRVLALGERDCSLQRRHQKVIEETPAPHLPPATRAALLAAATRLCAAADYRSAGTVEFLYDGARDEFFFLEVNTRLQVEHGVTEQVTGVDLVEWMVRGAAGDFAFLDAPAPPARGAAIQVRLYAEDPGQDYRPSSGILTNVRFCAGARVDTWVADGSEVSAHYDPLLAKVIVTAADRAAAVGALQRALDDTALFGLETNLAWLRQVVRSAFFIDGTASTQSLAGLGFDAAGIRVQSGGLATTVQDYPGRIGYWNVGVPPSGPMDTLAFRAGNRLLGNAEGAAGLEITAAGPSLLFHQACVICLTGAPLPATLDGSAVEPYAAVAVAPGQTLRTGSVNGAGLRGYLLFVGGLDVPPYLGSRSTFTLGQMGGHAGRALASGDLLRLADSGRAAALPPAPSKALPPAVRPAFGAAWTLRVLYGPHGAPDFFTEDDIAALQTAQWQVHHNSSRTGIRLIGPKPAWARRDGGEAGLHPSNIHDNAYVVGAIDFTGDMPIILGPDGPSLGGFVCPFVIIRADLWKIGQLAPGNTVRFERVDAAQAGALAADQDLQLQALPQTPAPAQRAAAAGNADIDRSGSSPVLGAIAALGSRPAVVYRRQGECALLVEYGPIVLDLELRLRVHALMLYLEERQAAGALAGVMDITPGIRSLQVHFDTRQLSQATLLQVLADAEERLGGLEDFAIPSRVVHLPLSWNDPAIAQTVQRYMASVRSDAPWCPDNIEFIRRINGLGSVEDVQRIVFDARYLVLGLGDVYLGAPVATPLDPRHRLVTTKYNPARTWTPPNVVGIGGAYLCIYGMEGPGGYQLFGRTLQVWNAYGRSPSFGGKPWLLRFFDQIRFFPVSHEELMEWRRDFPFGRRRIRVEEETFRLADYRRFLVDHSSDIARFQARRQAAFEAERADWEQRDEFARADALADGGAGGADAARIVVPEGSELVEAPLSGVVWKTLVQVGERVAKGAAVVSIEAMKMQCDVTTHAGGVVRAIYVLPAHAVRAGAPLVAIEPEG